MSSDAYVSLPPVPPADASESANIIKLKVTDIMSREEHVVDIGKWDTIGLLKRRVESKGMGPVDRQRLVHAGQVLRDEQTVLEAGLDRSPAVFLALKRLDTASTSGYVPLQPGAQNILNTPAPADSYFSQQQQPHQHRRAPPQTDDDDEPTCRICRETDNEDTGERRLFSPCLCRGSMRFVHVGCLNSWRAMSANPQSYYKCDACGYRYNLQRTAFADACHSYKVQEVCTVAVMLGLTLACGLLSRVASAYTAYSIERKLYEACQWRPPWQATPYAGHCDFVMCGMMLVGMAGFAMAAYKSYHEDMRGLWHLLMYLFAGSGTVAVRLVCFLGLIHSLRTVHTRVSEELKGALSRWGDAILEVSPAPRPENPAPSS